MKGKDNLLTEEIITRLHDIFKHQSDVELVYLFGKTV